MKDVGLWSRLFTILKCLRLYFSYVLFYNNEYNKIKIESICAWDSEEQNRFRWAFIWVSFKCFSRSLRTKWKFNQQTVGHIIEWNQKEPNNAHSTLILITTTSFVSLNANKMVKGFFVRMVWVPFDSWHKKSKSYMYSLCVPIMILAHEYIFNFE